MPCSTDAAATGHCRVGFALAAVFVLWPAVAQAQVAASDRPVARVGIVAFQDIERELEEHHQLLVDLTGDGERRLDVQLAIGTYADVLSWLDRAMIDVALLTPGVAAEMLGRKAEDGTPRFVYVVTQGVPNRKEAGYRFEARSECLVGNHSPFKTFEDVQQAVAGGRLRFVFVHPLSATGRIAPEFALRKVGITPRRDLIEYTDSHTGILRRLTVGDGVERVGFAWQGLADEEGICRRLAFPALDEFKIPEGAVVARAGVPWLLPLTARLLKYTDRQGEHPFRYDPQAVEHFAEVREWMARIGVSASSDEMQTQGLSEIGQSLLHYLRTHPDKPPRLALVLSGGGAKCSYQVGAVRALEEELAALRKSPGLSEADRKSLDLGLIVGTSGGAINALPIALGVSTTAEGQKDFEQVWTELDQRQIVRPPRLVRWNIGLWFALAQVGLVLWGVRSYVAEPGRRAWIASTLFVALGVCGLGLAWFGPEGWSWLGTNHVVHHLWLWLTFGMSTGGGAMLVMGLAGILVQRRRAKRGEHLHLPIRWTKRVLATGLLGLPFVQVATVLFYEETLSGGSGIEAVFAEKFTWLVNRELERRGQPNVDVPLAATNAERLRVLSDEIVRRGLVSRDLVLTGSCLEQTSASLPSDLYFHLLHGSAAEKAPFDSRGIALTERPRILLDVVMGSGSIFPMFPPREIVDLPSTGHRVQLVDGGFAHNSPVEAAVLWGATHVVVLAATPETQTERKNFVGNAGAAFEHLYQQAQLLDARTRGRIAVYTLTPEPPHLCVLDFADNLVRESIERGYRDARGESASSAGVRPRFRKELGEPAFFAVGKGTAR